MLAAVVGAPGLAPGHPDIEPSWRSTAFRVAPPGVEEALRHRVGRDVVTMSVSIEPANTPCTLTRHDAHRAVDAPPARDRRGKALVRALRPRAARGRGGARVGPELHGGPRDARRRDPCGLAAPGQYGLRRPSARQHGPPGGRGAALSPQARDATRAPIALRDRAVEGAGLAYLPDFLVEDVAAGRVKRVLPEWTSPPWQAVAIHRAELRGAARLRAFLDAVTA